MTCDASRAALPMCGVACQWGAPRLAVLGVGRTVGLASEKALASADEALGVGRPGSRRSGGPQDSGQSVGVWWNQHPGRGPQYLFHAAAVQFREKESRRAAVHCTPRRRPSARRARPSTRSPTQARSLTTTSLGEHAAMLSLRSPAAVEYPSEVPDSRHRVTAHPDPDSTSPRRDGRAPARCLASLG